MECQRAQGEAFVPSSCSHKFCFGRRKGASDRVACDQPELTHSLSQSLSEEEQKLFRLYGKLPNRKDIVGNKLKVRCGCMHERSAQLLTDAWRHCTAGAQVL